MVEQILIQVLIVVASGGAVYGAIRADIRHLHHRADHADSEITRAHDRIDRLHDGG